MGEIHIKDSSKDIIGPVTIEPHGGKFPEPIFWSKACRQLGVPSEIQSFKRDGEDLVRARLPVMPRKTYEAILKRARFLVEREQHGLPTEQLPSGRWPDSLDEFADQVPLAIAKDEENNSIYIDFGRPIQAIGISPAMARTIATMIVTAANEMDPDGLIAMSRPELVNVARIRVPEHDLEQEGTVALPSVFAGLKLHERPDDSSSFDLDNYPLIGICNECHCPQHTTPGGPSCKNGHGGAETIRPCFACSYQNRNVVSTGQCEAGLFQKMNINNNCGNWEVDQDFVASVVEQDDDE